MKMDRSLLVRVFGFRATLIHGDTLMLDRWLWLKGRLPETNNNEKLIDIGCGTGAFTIGAALRGYHALGLSWDERNQTVARDRATLCGAVNSQFEVQDVRSLHERGDLTERFDIAICLENIEHILDDRKLMRDIYGCLKPGGRLLLTTPYYHYKAITDDDNGPFLTKETGWHVRRGYTKSMLVELCLEVGLNVESISYCSGFLSQKSTRVLRILSRNIGFMGWAITFPSRILPPLFDRLLTPLLNWPYYSICLEAQKPRFSALSAEVSLLSSESVSAKLINGRSEVNDVSS